MTQAQDAAPREPVAFFTSPVDAAGFTATPNLVVLRHDLSLSAKLVYGYLGHLAWRARTSEVGTAREIIAADLGIGVKAVTGYIKELRDAPTVEGSEDPDCPRLVIAIRPGQGKPNVYGINPPEMGRSGKVGSTFLDGSIGPLPARARSSSRPKKTTTEELPPNPPLEVPPGIVLLGGRNLPLDALVEVCGITSSQMNTRMGQAVTALNGKLDRRGDLTEPGIRHVFWDEVRAQAAAAPDLDESEVRLRALQQDPERFARLLADRIRSKATAYRTNMPGAILTPKSLRDWWYDIGTGARPAAAGKDFSHLPDA